MGKAEASTIDTDTWGSTGEHLTLRSSGWDCWGWYMYWNIFHRDLGEGAGLTTDEADWSSIKLFPSGVFWGCLHVRWNWPLLKKVLDSLVSKPTVYRPPIFLGITNFGYAVTSHLLIQMPRIWLDYCQFLVDQYKITKTRRTFDRALRALPITQHYRVWPLYLKFVRKHPIMETAFRVYRRYLKVV